MRLLHVFLCGLALTAAGADAATATASNILASTLSSEELAGALAAYTRAPVDLCELRDWGERLSDRHLLKTDSSILAPLEVRDVAVVVVDAITGSHFATPRQNEATRVKEIVSCRKKEGVYRFHIPALENKQFEQIARNVSFWIEGYEAARQTHGKRKVPRVGSRP